MKNKTIYSATNMTRKLCFKIQHLLISNNINGDFDSSMVIHMDGNFDFEYK